MNNWTAKISAFHALLIAIGLVVMAIFAGGRWAVNEFRGIVADVTANSMELKAQEIGLLTTADLAEAFYNRDEIQAAQWEQVLDIADANLAKQDSLYVSLYGLSEQIRHNERIITDYGDRMLQLERKNGISINQSSEQIQANQYTDSLQMVLNRVLMQKKFSDLQNRLSDDRQTLIHQMRTFTNPDDRVIDKGRRKVIRQPHKTTTDGWR